MKDTVYLVCLSAFMLAGSMVVEGDIVEVTDSEARDLLGRNKARVATAEDGAPEDGQEGTAQPADDADADADVDAEAEAKAAQEAAAKAAAAKAKTKK